MPAAKKAAAKPAEDKADEKAAASKPADETGKDHPDTPSLPEKDMPPSEKLAVGRITPSKPVGENEDGEDEKEPTAEEREGVVTRTLESGKTETVAVDDDPNLSRDETPEREQASSTTTHSGKGEATLKG